MASIYANLLEQQKAFALKELNSQRIGLGDQHGRRFIVLGHQYGRHWRHVGKQSLELFVCCMTHEEKLSTQCCDLVAAVSAALSSHEEFVHSEFAYSVCQFLLYWMRIICCIYKEGRGKGGTNTAKPHRKTYKYRTE